MEHTTCDDQRPWTGRGRSQAWSRSACPSLRGRADRFRAGGSSRPRRGDGGSGRASGANSPLGRRQAPRCRHAASLRAAGRRLGDGGSPREGRWRSRTECGAGLRCRVPASAAFADPARILVGTGSSSPIGTGITTAAFDPPAHPRRPRPPARPARARRRAGVRPRPRPRRHLPLPRARRAAGRQGNGCGPRPGRRPGHRPCGRGWRRRAL
jgi:hypothetical protein